MNCKYCNAELLKDTLVCPVCGKDNGNDPELLIEETKAVCVESAEMTEPEQLPQENDEPVEETPPVEESTEKSQGKPWKRIMAGVCAVALLGALILGLLMGMGVDLKVRSNDAMYKSSYTITDAEALNAPNKVIASMEDVTLDNELFQVYYWAQVYGFIDYYGGYYFDYSQPLDAQIFSEETGMTWQQYFVEAAVESWAQYAALNNLAAEEGFVLDEDYFAEFPAQLEASALNYGYESAEAMVKSDMGQMCTLEAYWEYIAQIQTANQFAEQKSLQWEPTEEDLENFYKENEAVFTESGITKDSGPMVDVRHILVQPEGEKTDGEYSEDQWKACLEEAERILNEWKTGEATEESFADLAKTYSADGGSKSIGGLYTGITPTSSYVPNFLEWSVDEARVVGDTGIVQTEFGYHIMYFVDGEPMWMIVARNNYQADMLNKMITEGKERWPVSVKYKNILLTDVNVTE